MSIGTLFAPDSIAVFGASDRLGSWGRHLAEGALRSGVDVQLINPRLGGSATGVCAERDRRRLAVGEALQLGGVCFSALPQRPAELAVIAVPAADFAATVDVALAAGARSVVGITAGLSPADSHHIASRVRDQGANLLGPNCLGVFDSRSGLSLLWGDLPAGDVTLFSQSGNLSLELGAIARRSGLGFRRFASLGDCADLRAADLLAHHGDARAVALYLEDLRGGRELIGQAASLVDSGVPVALLAAGSSASGAAAATSHTGALAGDHAVLAAACRDAGVRLVSTPTELIEACRAPGHRVLAGRRLGIVCDGGGHGVIAADLAEAAGLDVPVPPVDLAGAGERDLHAYAKAVAGLASNADIDAVLLTGYFGGYSAEDPAMADLEMQVAAEIAAVEGAAVFVQSFAGFPAAGPSATVRRLTEAGVPVWAAVEHAIAAIAAAADRPARMPSLPDERAGTLPVGDPYWTGRELLPSVRFARAEEVFDTEGAVAAAGRIGYPVVLKALGRAHKSDGGGVVVGLATEEAVVEAFAALPHSPAYAVEQQHDLADGVEILVGARRDRSFGPVVVVGAGGLLTELLGDSAVALAPVDRDRARELVRSLRVHRLLAGYRGRPPVSEDALVDVIVVVAEAICRHPEIASVELNPVLVTAAGAIALDCHWENVS